MNRRLRTALRARRASIDRVAYLRHRPAERRLAASKPRQRADWERFAARAAGVYDQLTACGDPEGVTPLWSAYIDGLERALLPTPPWRFLHHPLLLETMLVRGTRLSHRELRWLRSRLPASRLATMLEEDPAGCPTLSVRTPPSSPTSLHHLFHLERFRRFSGAAAGDLNVVVEWGGGFGGFARTLRRSSTGAPPAHVLIDLPLISALQWTYLCTVFGEEHVDLALASGHRPRPGALTIVPAALSETLDVEADLFVSLWGLSETAADTQDAVAAGGFSGAQHLLLAFQRSGPDTPEAERVRALAVRAGAVTEPVGVLSHSHYALR